MNRATTSSGLIAVAVGVLAVVSGCGGSSDTSGTGDSSGEHLSGAVVIDGSSTIEPLSSVAAELFQSENPDVNVTVGTSGTGGGFKKFCAGETDISDASRPISNSEIALCKAAGISYEDLQVANDALTIVVNTDNTWATCLTVAQLKKIWEPNSTVKNWNQVDPAFPDEALTLYGAGPDSGTFDFFTGAINGKEGSSRTDYNPTEDDNVTVQGVSGSKGAMGYFGYSYYEENADKLTAVKVDGGAGCVEPSVATTQDGTYTPLSRPLLIYPSDAGLSKPQVEAFVEFYLEQNEQIVTSARFIPLTPAQLTEQKAALEKLKAIVGGGSAATSSATTSGG